MSSDNAQNKTLLDGNGEAQLEMVPPNLTYRGGGASNGGPGGRTSCAQKPASRCACCRVCGIVTLALLSVAVLALAVGVAWHQLEIAGLKTGLNQTSESGNYYGKEIQTLKDELITLRSRVKLLQTGLEAIANGSGGGGKFDFIAAYRLGLREARPAQRRQR